MTTERLEVNLAIAYNQRNDLMVAEGVWHAADRDLRNARKRRHRRLDHLRADLVAAEAKHVLVAPGDHQEPLGVESGDVARLEPAVAEHALAAGRFPEIAIDRERAADPQQTFAPGRLHDAVAIDDLRP